MLYVFLLVIVASLLLSAFSVDELLHVLDGLSFTEVALLTLLGAALVVLIWRARRRR